MKILIAADHAGFESKKMLTNFLSGLGHEVQDFGAYELNGDDDYPDFMKPLAEKIASGDNDTRGIIIGGSGQGEAMAVNRVKGVRAAVIYCYDERALKFARSDNDSNVLSLGARFLSEDEIKKAVELWLGSPFSRGERHVRRIAKLDQ
jgi:ribose 5-phosphate isomerase B